jgi:hypothetical protein
LSTTENTRRALAKGTQLITRSTKVMNGTIRRDHILVRPERLAVPHSGVEVHHPGRLGRSVGVRGKIHGRNLHGSIGSARSQQRTVDAEINPTIPSLTAWAASSTELHLDNGAPLASGGWHAIALVPAAAAAANTLGRPDRGRSFSPARPPKLNRLRQRDTTSTPTPSRSAITVLAKPAAANNTIRARTT